MMFARCDAQVSTAITSDGTMGTVITDQGAVFNITGGTRPAQGPNLFHSFSQFDVGTGDTAHFVGQPGVDNIIGRVTGGRESLIDGRLQSDASLFLLNPSGLMFGPNATLDVHGSFHASTADALRFADGAAFSAHLNAKSTLTVASPAAFGFLNAAPAGIEVQGSELSVPEGDTLSMVGGDIAIVGDGDPASDAPNLAAPGGQINLASVASSGDVGFNPVSERSELEVESFEQLGDMLIAEGGLVDVSGEGGGTVIIRSGTLLIDQSRILADTRGHMDGAEIGVDIAADELVLTNGGLVTTDVTESGTGNAGILSIVARNLRVSGGSQIRSITFGPGHGGMVTVRATDINLEGATPDNRFLSGILATTQGEMENAGDAGDLLVEAQHVQLKGGAQIGSSTFGPGHGGMVTVRATDISLEGITPDNRFLSGIFSSTTGAMEDAGDAGDLLVEAQHVQLKGGAQIASTTFGPGHGGTATVRATDISLEGATPDNLIFSGIFVSTRGAMENAGDAGDLLVEAQHVQLAERAVIGSNTFGPGNGGDLTIQVDRLILLLGGAVGSAVFGDGLGGQVTIKANEEIRLIGSIADGLPSGLISLSSGKGNPGRIRLIAPSIVVDGSIIGTAPFGSGRTAEIEIVVDHLILTNSGFIVSITDSDISAGTITISAKETVSISTGGIFASTGTGMGHAGNIIINTARLRLTEGGQIDSSTLGPGHGGTVKIMATGTVEIIGPGSSISTNTGDRGVGGEIELQAQQVQLTEEAIISSSSSGKGDAGDIRIAAQEIDLRGDSVITTTVDQGEASGGNILIGGAITDDGVITDRVETLTLDGSQITADTDTGSGANITIGVQHLMLDGASAITANTGAGTGGNLRVAGAVTADGTITARADTVVLRGSQLTANAGPGMGGRIDIVTEVFLADPASVVDASSQAGGVDGVVNVEAVVSNLSGIVKPLSSDFASAAELLRDQCAAQLQKGTVSSLVARGPASVPASPEGIQPSRLYQPSLTSTLPHKSERQPGKTDAPQQGMLAVAPSSWPQIINDPFPAHAPVALKCEWTKP
jgi:filamentous hemagglutinin family protein